MAFSAQSTIPAEIKALNLPDHANIVLFAGAAMEFYNVRLAEDIDVVVSYKNWVYVRDTLKWDQYTKFGRRYLESPDMRFEVWRWWYDPRRQLHRIYFPEILSHSYKYEGLYWVIDCDYLIATKKMLGRPKDLADIKLLQQA